MTNFDAAQCSVRYGIAVNESAHSRSRARWFLTGLAVLLVAAATLLWRHTALAEIATPERLQQWLESFQDAPWAPFAVTALFVLGGLVVFPLSFMIAATSVVFDPLVAFLVSMTGALASAALLYFIGAKLIRGVVLRALGASVSKVSAALENRGILAVAVARNVPVAPYSFVNLAAGSIGIRFSDYLIGTAIGLTPGILVLTLFGNQLRAVLEDPTPLRLAAIAGIAAAWIGLSLLLQKFSSR